MANENKRIKEKHILKKPTFKVDFDIIFCDNEGTPSLDGVQKSTIPGILTLLKIYIILQVEPRPPYLALKIDLAKFTKAFLQLKSVFVEVSIYSIFHSSA